MPYYPELSVIAGLVRVRRERRLPPQALPRPTHTIAGGPVEALHVVLEGDILREYRILDVGAHFKLRKPDPDQLAGMIQVTEGQNAHVGQELARRDQGRRSKVMHSPVEGQVVLVTGGRIIIQVSERAVEVLAKIPGEVEEVESHRVRLAGNGALIQGAWGNGQFVYAAFRFLPEDGFLGLSKMDVRISEYRQVVIVSPYALNKGDLMVAKQQEVAGVVAPSMPSNLREFALQLKFPVLLTEGFGQRRPTALIYNLLQSNMGRQATFDAAIPDRWSGDRPEIMIPLPSGGVTPPLPALDQALTVGMQVRITRAPWDGLVGKVVELPDTPQVIDNGLRLPCAKIQLRDGPVGLVPLANLELLV